MTLESTIAATACHEPALLGHTVVVIGGSAGIGLGGSWNTWHSAFGGGISLAFLTASNTVTATFAHGKSQTGFYLGTGFMF